MATVNISVADKNDIPAIVDLLGEVDEFYGDDTAEGLEERADKVTSVLFGKEPAAYALLARAEGGQAIGFASYSFLWPAAGSSRSLYLKELYVANGYRQSGAGRQLMQELFDIAKTEGCSRVEWTTDATNMDAQTFYAKLGESVSTDKLFYRHEIH